MKTNLTFAALLLFASCGGSYNLTNGTTLGEERSLVIEQVSAGEVQLVQTLCSALAEKASLLSTGVAQNYDFVVSQKKCEETSGSTPAVVNVYTEISGSNYNFKRSDNSALFIYPDIETQTSGVTKELCSRLSSLASPIKLSNGNALWFEISRDGMTDCSPSSGDVCLMVETGLPTGEKYKIVSREFIKFQLNRTLPKFGFFTTRRSYSNAFCTGSNFAETSAAIK